MPFWRPKKVDDLLGREETLPVPEPVDPDKPTPRSVTSTEKQQQKRVEELQQERRQRAEEILHEYDELDALNEKIRKDVDERNRKDQEEAERVRAEVDKRNKDARETPVKVTPPPKIRGAA